MSYPHLINSHDTTEKKKKKPRFAKTVAIALGIADQLQLPAIQVFGPTLAMLLGKDQLRSQYVLKPSQTYPLPNFFQMFIQFIPPFQWFSTAPHP